MALSPSDARSTAYVCSRSPLASTCAACGSSSTRSTRINEPIIARTGFILDSSSEHYTGGSETRCSMTFRTLSPACALLLLGATLGAADKKITAQDLPPAVAKAVQDETKGATIKGYSKEVEHGKTMYEVETTLNGKSRDLLFDAAGKLVTT